jgi:hypothetical protein
MKALTAALLVCVAACGEGRAIFNVDVLSFLADSSEAYNIPGGIPQADSAIVEHFSLPPGFGKSSTDSVSATIAASLANTAGGGSVTLSIFFARDSASIFAGTPYVTASSGAVSGVQTVPFGSSTVSINDSVFNASDLWVGIRARFSTNLGPNMTGQLTLTNLSLRVVLQDKVF